MLHNILIKLQVSNVQRNTIHSMNYETNVYINDFLHVSGITFIR